MRTSSDMLRDLRDKIGTQVGLLGGTFDPVHNGHLAIASAVKNRLGLDAILFIPAPSPPHKRDSRLSPFDDRVAMLELATSGRPEFLVTSLEAERPGPSYSVDTLRRLHALWGGKVRLFFIIGLDAFVEIASWKEYEKLPELADLVVLNRPSHGVEEMRQTIERYFRRFHFDHQEKVWRAQELGARIFPFVIEPVAVSSTRVRRMAGQGQPVTGLVPTAVEDYIREHGLYDYRAGSS